MRKIVIALSVMMLVVLTGCGKLDLVIHDDGSGKGKFSVDLSGMISADELKEELEKEITNANADAGKEVIRLDSFTEKDGKVDATVSFDSLTALSGGEDSLLATVADMKRLYPERINELVEAPGDIEKIVDKPVVYLNLDDDMEITVTVPGNILYATGGTVAEGKPRTLQLAADEAVIVYEPSGNRSWMAWIGVLLVVVIAAYFIYRKGWFRTASSGTKGGNAPNA
ncbi:hypothetical protein [Paenibacillus lactis]|uniref:hypothetical protein n=1 Tax=Paenibacillus lactis TaxID=228574 RepID=UPI00369EBE60